MYIKHDIQELKSTPAPPRPYVQEDEKITLETLLSMELHDDVDIPNQPYCILRVPGGWIYRNFRTKHQTFVPEPNNSLTI